MSDNNEEAVERINSTVEDGGGCAETWEALTEIRNNANPTDRRGLLKSLGVVGSATLLFTTEGAASASPSESVDTSVRELSGERRDRAIEDAWNSPEVKAIIAEFTPNETENTEQASAVVSSYDGGHYRTVMIPFETPNKNESLTVTWTDNEKLEPLGRRTAYQEEGSKIKARVKTYYIKDSSVVTETNIIEPRSNSTTGTDGEIGTQVVGGPCGPTEIIDFDCAGEIIYIYAEEISACGTCAASAYTTGANPLTYTACASCLGLYLKEAERTGRPCQLCNPITLG